LTPEIASVGGIGEPSVSGALRIEHKKATRFRNQSEFTSRYGVDCRALNWGEAAIRTKAFKSEFKFAGVSAWDDAESGNKDLSNPTTATRLSTVYPKAYHVRYSTNPHTWHNCDLF
jgi:hypothetical protein